MTPWSRPEARARLQSLPTGSMKASLHQQYCHSIAHLRVLAVLELVVEDVEEGPVFAVLFAVGVAVLAAVRPREIVSVVVAAHVLALAATSIRPCGRRQQVRHLHDGRHELSVAERRHRGVPRVDGVQLGALPVRVLVDSRREDLVQVVRVHIAHVRAEDPAGRQQQLLKGIQLRK